MEYLSRFDYDIQYIKGQLNKVADALLRYYESDTWFDAHPLNKYVNADVWLDWEMDHLSPEQVDDIQSRKVEMHTTWVESTLTTQCSKQLLDKKEARDLEAAKIASGMKEAIPVPTQELSVLMVPQTEDAEEPVQKSQVPEVEEDLMVYKSCLYTEPT